MRKYYLSLLFIFHLFLFKQSFAQEFADKEFYLIDSLDLNELAVNDRLLIDSLLTTYHKSKIDTVKLNQISTLISECENEVWLSYNQFLMDEAKLLYQKTSNNIYKKHLASAHNNFGFYYYSIDKNLKAINSFKRAIELSEEIKDIAVIPTALNNLGYIYKQQGDILRALDYYHKSLSLNQKLNDKEEEALCLNNIGSIYYYQKEYDKALKYYRDALLIEKEYGSEKGTARLYSNIGSIYKEQNKYKLALEYFEQSIKIYTKLKIKRGLATSLSKKASIELNLYKDSLEDPNNTSLKEILNQHLKAYGLFEELDDNEGKAYSLLNISLTYQSMGEINTAEDYAKKSIELAKKLGFPESIKNAAKILEQVALSKKRFKEAYNMQELYYQMLDSINNQSIYDATIQKQYEYEYQKKAIQDSLASIEAQKIKDLKYYQEIQTQKTYTIVGIIALVLMGVVVVVVFRGYQQKKQSNNLLANKNKVIEEKNKEITDSIMYAKRIQEAILPSSNLLNEYLKDGFVLYKPKDIVAGDFYWLQNLTSTNKVLFAVADCTGHGVPGAMVSVVCHHALNRSVREYKLNTPGIILDKTREIVIETFSQNNSFSVRDGMDIAMCLIDYNTNTIEFSGANNPLYIISNNQDTINNLPENCKSIFEYGNNLFEIKGDKQPIGKHINEHHKFTTQKIKVNKGDMIYLFSDGYADQFGGEKGKKLKYKYFKKLLLLNSPEDMNHQKKALSSFFDEWRGEIEQIDDVCILGVKI